MDTSGLTEQQQRYWLLIAELAEQERLADRGEGDLARVHEINDELNRIAGAG